MVRKDDIVLTTSGNCGNVAAINAEPERPTAATNFIRILRVDPEVADPRYAFHYLRSRLFAGAIAPFVRGATIKNLSVEAAFDAIDMPTPPLTEQRRIAAILDHAQALRDKRRQVLAHLDALVLATFHSMFGRGNFPSRPLGAHIANQQIGLDRRGADQGPERAHEYVRMDAITRGGRMDLTSVTRVDATPSEVAKYSLADGDLLLNTRNSRELVGKTAVYRGRPRLYNNNIMRIRFDDALLTDYVHQYLWTIEGRRQLEARKSGTTSVFAVYAKSVATLMVPMPPVALQRSFAHRVRVIDHQRASVVRGQAMDDELFASLQSRAFRGEL